MHVRMAHYFFTNTMKIRSKKHISMVKLKTDYIVLNENSGRYLKTNSLGAKIIKLIQDKHTFPELLNKICQIYSIDKKTASKDLKFFLNKAKGLEILDLTE